MLLDRPTVVALDDDGDRLRRRDVVARTELLPRVRVAHLGIEDGGQLGRSRAHRHSPAHDGDTRTVNPDYLRYWPLDPDVIQLNHGSYGACPWPVLRAQDEWRARMERNSTQFMGVELEPALEHARGRLGEFVGADPDDLAFVPNATTGVNTVLRSLESTLQPGDEILTTDHDYNACLNAMRATASRSGVRGRRRARSVPAARRRRGARRDPGRRHPAHAAARDQPHHQPDRARPARSTQIVAGLAERGIDTLVDGAHAPGMLPLDLDALGAAYYTGNCHKWLCAPKGSGFLHVRRDRQAGIRPLVTSHGANSPRRDRSPFRLEFDWLGTSDPTAYLSIPAALDFMAGLVDGGWPEVMRRNRDWSWSVAGRCWKPFRSTKTESVPDEMIGSWRPSSCPPSWIPDRPIDRPIQTTWRPTRSTRCMTR